MKIVHVAPFGLGNGGFVRCGLYEAARDFYRLDKLAGHEVVFIDTGASNGVTREERRVGTRDDRGGFLLSTSSVEDAKGADIIVGHDVVPEDVMKVTSCPVVMICHGRPLDCFRPEYQGRNMAYSFHGDFSRQERCAFMVTLWKEHLPYWSVLVDDKKLRCIGPPTLDMSRYKLEGEVHKFPEGKSGKFNLLVADSWRSDVDCFEIAHVPVELYKRGFKDFKIHFYAVDQPLRSWEWIFRKYRELGIQGEVWARAPRMDEVYRAMDLVITPHKIATRIVMEAQCCGCPVMGDERGQEELFWLEGSMPDRPEVMAKQVDEVLSSLEKRNREEWRMSVAAHGEMVFSEKEFSKRMQGVYEEALSK